MLRFDPKIVEKTAFPSGGEENLIGWLALGWLAGQDRAARPGRSERTCIGQSSTDFPARRPIAREYRLTRSPPDADPWLASRATSLTAR
ncbi:MAG: hypothetical protein HXL68_03740 [Dechloromonas agitata]|uniref:Uncharacterized protein n=1 Tax=Dechloromonas agitata TaxID=73030 RepID=A0A930BQZ1_9RHOO|nr:hypothetical protein [Dechloromonas agitata]